MTREELMELIVKSFCGQPTVESTLVLIQLAESVLDHNATLLTEGLVMGGEGVHLGHARKHGVQPPRPGRRRVQGSRAGEGHGAQRRGAANRPREGREL